MQENEISLKELILILLKGWKWIIGTTALCLVLGLLVLVTFNTSTYQVNISGSITKADNFETAFGVYPADTYNNIDLINLVKSNEFVKIITDDESAFTITPSLSETGDFTITLNSNESTILSEASSSVIDSFQEYINYKLQYKAIEYFVDIHKVTLERTVLTVENNTKLVETLTQKLNSIDRLIAPDIINPEYDVFSSQRATIEFETIRLRNEIEKIATNLEQLEKLNSKDFNDYKMKKDHLDIIKASVDFNESYPVQEIHRINALTLIPISVILGGMLGVFIVFFLNYWRNN